MKILGISMEQWKQVKQSGSAKKKKKKRKKPVQPQIGTAGHPCAMQISIALSPLARVLYRAAKYMYVSLSCSMNGSYMLL